MPHPREFPGMLRAVVPLMRRQRLRGVIGEFVAFALRRTGRRSLSGGRSGLVPGLPAIVGTLNDLPEPSAGLRRVDAIGIGGRAFQVIHLPARKMGPADIPFFALAVLLQNKCTFARTYQDPHLAHSDSPD